MLTPCGSVDCGDVSRLRSAKTDKVVGPPMDCEGPPTDASVVKGDVEGGAKVPEDVGAGTGTNATLRHDGVDEYTELALDLPPIPYITPSALPS